MAENEQCSRCGVKYTHGFAFGKLKKIDDELVCANCLTNEEVEIYEKTKKVSSQSLINTIVVLVILVIIFGLWVLSNFPA